MCIVLCFFALRVLSGELLGVHQRSSHWCVHAFLVRRAVAVRADFHDGSALACELEVSGFLSIFVFDVEYNGAGGNKHAQGVSCVSLCLAALLHVTFRFLTFSRVA